MELLKPEDHLDYVYNVGNCIPRFYKMPRHSPGSKIAVANNDNYCPDIFKHSRLLAEAMMETLKKYINILKCSVNQIDAPDIEQLVWKPLKSFGS